MAVDRGFPPPPESGRKGINYELNLLIRFALRRGLIGEEDAPWAANGLLGALGLMEFRPEAVPDDDVPDTSPDGILERILDWAESAGVIEGGSTERDLLDTRLMGVFTPRPSDVLARFQALYRDSPRAATDWFYTLGVASNYVRAARTGKNILWQTDTEFGKLDITINLSKPEKDPRDIAKAGKAVSTGYPRCLLCRENEGFVGHAAFPARQNLRLVPLSLRPGQEWFLQYSPYSYYNEHCIVLNGEHVPMVICRETFENLLRFLELFPHYFIGSNADLPIVGGSILSHDHYQGGRFAFALDRADVEVEYAACEGVSMGRVRWPLSVLRLTSEAARPLIDRACAVLEAWRDWSDPEVGVLARTDAPHNTVTPIARRRDGRFELDLVLRNNRTGPEHPLGIFHPHAEVQHIKKENIGLIEVLGLAILPPRLKGALEEMTAAWERGEGDLSAHPALAAHDAWYRALRARHSELRGAAEVDSMFRDEVGHVFVQVLSDCGVFKRTPEGFAAFDRFVGALG